jgi:hypothetical protein
MVSSRWMIVLAARVVIPGGAARCPSGVSFARRCREEKPAAWGFVSCRQFYAGRHDISATRDVGRMSCPPARTGGMRVLVIEVRATSAGPPMRGAAADQVESLRNDLSCFIFLLCRRHPAPPIGWRASNGGVTGSGAGLQRRLPCLDRTRS